MTFSLVMPGLAQEDLLENFLQQEQESNEASESRLQELLASPLDLNRANAAELQRLPFLSRAQIDTFLAYRRTEIYFNHLEQALLALQVRGDTLAFCRTIFTLSPPNALRSSKNLKATMRSRSGVPSTIEKNWLGKNYRLYHRIQIDYGEFHLGALAERDPGELHWNDHRVSYVEWRTKRSRVLLGNFQTEWGLGLAQWSPYGATISADAHAAARHWGRGLVPYLSTHENAGYNGIAAACAGKHWAALAFISSTLRDVTLNEQGLPSTYRNSGNHRTANEAAQRNNLRERAGEVALQYRIDEGRELGLLFHTEQFNRAWQVAGAQENFFDFTGARNSVFSIAGGWQWAKHMLNFELAQSRNQGKAAALVLTSHEKVLSWTLALFHVDRNFHSARGRSLLASDEPAQAQSGYSAGLTLKPHPKLRGEFYYQREQKLWRTQTVPLPPQARLAGARLEWAIARELNLRLRYSFSENERLVHDGEQTPQAVQGITRWRCELEHRLSSRLRLQPRLDLIRPRKIIFAAATNLNPQPKSFGVAIALDVSCRLSSKFVFSFRQSHFDTSLPVYQYERDLPGVFTVAALRERGVRRYIYWHLSLHPSFSVTGKISGGEPDIYAAPTHSRLAWGLQLDWTFR